MEMPEFEKKIWALFWPEILQSETKKSKDLQILW